MKKIFFIVLITTFVVSSCDILDRRIEGNGHTVTEQRNVRDARRIHLSGNFDVVLTPGATTSLKIDADDNLLPYIVTNEEGGKLVIKTRDNTNLSSHNDIKVTVTTDKLEEISLSGAGSIKGTDKFIGGDALSLDVSGAGSINLDVNTPKVTSHLSGVGSINISGETKDADLHISGVGSFKGSSLKAENVKVQLSGTGSAYVFASTALDVSISGIGSVNYSGNPTVTQHVSGLGSVKKVD